MCGRFYIDDDVAREIEKTIRKIDEQLGKVCRSGDVHPTDMAAVIAADKNELVATPKRWGFPGFGVQKVIINARAESVLEKKTFRESVLKRRVIIPATGFYEWNLQKEKVTFTPMDREEEKKPILYMAGFYNRFEAGDRFVILTTAANESMKDVHDRMPLILEPDEVEEWLREEGKLGAFLHKIPKQLEKRQEYEQQTLQFGFDS